MLWSLFEDILRPIKNIRDRIFLSLTRGAGGRLTQLWVRLNWHHHCEVDVLKEKHFWIEFVANLVKVPKKCTGCYNNIQRQNIEVVNHIWAVLPLQKWLHLWPIFKMMLITFCDVQGLVHHKILHKGHNINQIFHGPILHCLQDMVCWKWPHRSLPIPDLCTLTIYCAQLPCMSGSSCQAQHPSGSLPALPYLTPIQLPPVTHAEDEII